MASESDSQVIAASHSEVVLQEAAERDVVVAFVGKPHRMDTRSRHQVRNALESIRMADYFVPPESLRGFVQLGLRSDDLVDEAERKTRLDVLEQCLLELTRALELTNKPDPWGPDIKLTGEFLDPLFKLFYERPGIPQATFKRDYHGLADAIPIEQIDKEVITMLDLIGQVVAGARPATGLDA